jgi:TIR domain-containing protein
MVDDFKYDVFLSHSSKDKAVVRKLAKRLKADGVDVWFDESELKPGDSIPHKIEKALEQSRVLVLCMSSHAFGSDWAQLEAYTFRFRDPLNKVRRFIPLRLDDPPPPRTHCRNSYILIGGRWTTENIKNCYSLVVCNLRSLPNTLPLMLAHPPPLCLI